MAKHRADPEKATVDYYKLNTKAINELISANVENSPEVTAKELKKYGGKPRLAVSQWIKALAVKIWFSGVICYFFLWGIGSYGINTLDLWVITAVALGFITDIATNNILRLIEKKPDENARYMMFTRKKRFVTLPLNIVYAFILMALDVMTYSIINRVVPLGVEPILFGVITTLWDMLLISFKHLFRRILDDAKAAQNKN